MSLPADTYLTLNQLNVIFQNLIISVLGYSVDNWAAYLAAMAANTWNVNNSVPVNPYELVRTSWSKGGAPAWKIEEDVLFLRLTAVDDPYNQSIHTVYSSYDDNDLVESKGVTSVNNIQFVLYGPNSYDNANLISDRLFRQENHDILALNNVYLIRKSIFPKRVPELFQGQYWERSDFNICFNNLIIRNELRGKIKSAKLSFTTDDLDIETALTTLTLFHP